MQAISRAAIAAAVLALHVLAGSNLRGNGKNLFWQDGKVTLRVSRIVHLEGGDTGVDKSEPAASVHAAVFEAARSWVRPGRGKVELDLDFTDTRTVSAGENVVTFTDPAPFDTGVCDKERFIACTLVSFHEDGTIASAVVAFNPYKRHSSVGLAGTHNIALIFEGAPAPTQLNGISVRVAGRFVPVASVKPEELVFESPAAAGSGEAKVLVASGTSMESNG
jgi:hypothetical protein